MNAVETDFGWALFHLRQGMRVTRRGWNAVGLWAVMQKGYPAGIPCNVQTAEALRIPVGTIVVIEPYFLLSNTSGTFVNWVPSTGDLLALDWEVVPDPQPFLPLEEVTHA